MKTKWDLILSELGSKNVINDTNALQSCPLHPGPSSLTVISDPVLDYDYFSCSTCKFNGDIIDLVAKKLKITNNQAFDLFLPGNRFSHANLLDCNSISHEEYFGDKQTQTALNSFIEKCHNYLISTTEGNSILNKLQQLGWLSNINDIPKTIGLLQCEYIPQEFPELDANDYRNKTCLIMAYSFNNNISALDIYDIDTNITKTIHIRGFKSGMFLADNINNSCLIIAQTPLIALKIHQIQQTFGIATNVVAISGLPIPIMGNYMPKSISYISSIDIPAKLDRIVKSIDSKFIFLPKISGITDIKVLNIRQRAINELSPDEILSLNKYGLKLQTWISNEIIDIYKKYGVNELNNMLYNNLTKEDFDNLISVLQDKRIPDNIIQDLKHVYIDIKAKKILNNGYIVYKTDSGLVGIKPNGDKKFLSNVYIHICDKVVTQDNKLFYYCDLQACYRGIPECKNVRIPVEVFDSTLGLKTEITKAYANIGFSPPVTMYTVQGFEWQEIWDIFSDVTTVRRIASRLGSDYNGNITLPSVTIFHNGIQHNNSMITNDDMPSYLGITPGPNSIEAYKELFSTNTIAAKTVSSIISFIIYWLLIDYLIETKKCSLVVKNKHLLILNSTNSVDSGVKAILKIVNDRTTFDTFEFSQALNMKRAMAHLGKLPAIGYVNPEIKKCKIITLLNEFKQNLLMISDEHILRLLNAETGLTYIRGTNDESSISDELIFKLKQETAYFIYVCLQKLSKLNYRDIFYSTNPALFTYTSICDVLSINKVEVGQITKSSLVGYSAPLVDIFLDNLHLMLTNTKHVGKRKRVLNSLKLIDIESSTILNTILPVPTEMFRTKTHVYINKYIINIINVIYKTGLNIEDVYSALLAEKYIDLSEYNVFFKIKMDIWKSRIKPRQHRMFKLVTPGLCVRDIA